MIELTGDQAVDLARHYPIRTDKICEDEDIFYTAKASAFPGITGDGETPEQAAEDLIGVLADIILIRISNGKALPAV